MLLWTFAETCPCDNGGLTIHASPSRFAYLEKHGTWHPDPLEKYMLGRHVDELVTLILEKANTGLQLFDQSLTDAFPMSEQEYRQKRVEVFFEFVSFFAHITSRITFKKCGPLTRQQLNDTIGTHLVTFTTRHFYEPISKDEGYKIPDTFKQCYYDYLNTSEREYASCTAWILKEDEDISYADKQLGEKSKGTINLLTDNITRILSLSNPITYYKIQYLLITYCLGSVPEFEQIVSRIENEI